MVDREEQVANLLELEAALIEAIAAEVNPINVSRLSELLLEVRKRLHEITA